ncbi:MAG: radical SAM protein, partial [Elusimicrobia bacterium]|nr:radical SAM protein [Elusimicrobiota bacterium]
AFLDENLTFNREHIEKICNLIIKENIKIPWSCPNGIRADKIDDNLIKLMKKAGCYRLSLGIESANETILKNIVKGESIDTIKKAISILKQNKIISHGFFIFGLPGETKKSINETINFALTSGLDQADFMILDMRPGTDLWYELSDQFTPIFSTKNGREPIWIPDGLTRNDLVQAQSEAVKKFYFRPKIFLKMIPFIRLSQIVFIIKWLFKRRVFSSKQYDKR